MLSRFRYRFIINATAAILLSVLSFSVADGQQDLQKPTRQSALDAYSAGRYEKALSAFTALSAQFPADPLYKYYRGVCLVRLNQNPLLAERLLADAEKSSVAVKNVPSDALFWTGRARQQAGMYAEAVDAFRQFADAAGKKISKELGVEDYISECQAGRGVISVVQLKESTDSAVAKQSEKTQPGKMIFPDSSTVQSNPDVIPLPSAADSMFESALSGRHEPDTSLLNKQKPAEEKITVVPPRADTTVTVAVIADTVPEKPVTEKIFSFFETGIPADKNKVILRNEIFKGLVYRIQVAVFRNPVAEGYFKGIGPVYGILNEQTGVTSYYAGIFRRHRDAQLALNRVKETGFKDAFIVAHGDGKPVSQERAAYLEKEWGSVPLAERPAEKPIQEKADTIPPTLIFRVEVARTAKPLSQAQTEELRKVAGPRGLEIIVNDSKQNIYLIGKFLTFRSASEFSDLLVRNGYREAKVTAYLGSREIPVDTARQLFEDER